MSACSVNHPVYKQQFNAYVHNNKNVIIRHDFYRRTRPRAQSAKTIKRKTRTCNFTRLWLGIPTTLVYTAVYSHRVHIYLNKCVMIIILLFVHQSCPFPRHILFASTPLPPPLLNPHTITTRPELFNVRRRPHDDVLTRCGTCSGRRRRRRRLRRRLCNGSRARSL